MCVREQAWRFFWRGHTRYPTSHTRQCIHLPLHCHLPPCRPCMHWASPRLIPHILRDRNQARSKP